MPCLVRGFSLPKINVDTVFTSGKMDTSKGDRHEASQKHRWWLDALR